MPDHDASLARNLDTQHRRLTELEHDVAALLDGDLSVAPAVSIERPPLRYDELTAANDTLRADRGWDVVDLDAALTPALRAEFERWQARQRLPWDLDDVVAVAVAGMVGITATWFDSTIDAAVVSQLKVLKDTELIRGWERDARRMPIDYMGPGFGGHGHRVRSAGHDIGRPFEALRQIRQGQFQGLRWDHGERHTVVEDRYRPVETLGEALTLWGKHLVCDLITPMSLPLPGWSKIYELPSRELRQFAHRTYDHGTNLRTAALAALPVFTTEVVVRTHVHGRALLVRGTAELTSAESSLRTELLLAGHTLVGAASISKTLALALAAPVPAAALSHLNLPVLIRAATLAIEVAADARTRRAAGARSWDDLLADLAEPWQLDTAAELAARATGDG